MIKTKVINELYKTHRPALSELASFFERIPSSWFTEELITTTLSLSPYIEQDFWNKKIKYINDLKRSEVKSGI